MAAAQNNIYKKTSESFVGQA